MQGCGQTGTFTAGSKEYATAHLFSSYIQGTSLYGHLVMMATFLAAWQHGHTFSCKNTLVHAVIH